MNFAKARMGVSIKDASRDIDAGDDAAAERARRITEQLRRISKLDMPIDFA